MKDRFTNGYVEAALWAEHDDQGAPLDQTFDVHDFDGNALKKMEDDCTLFQKQQAAYLDGFYDAGFSPEHAGHDFWLTRNRHGSGFWDEKAPEDVTKTLTDAAHAMGEQDVYVGSSPNMDTHPNGLLYISGTEEPYDPNKLPLTPSDEALMRDMGIRASRKAPLLRKAEVDWKFTRSREQALEALKAGPKTTDEIGTILEQPKSSMIPYSVLKSLQSEGKVRQHKMRWYLVASIVRGYAIAGRRTLQPWDWHALRIALDTMKMHPAMQGVMGGPTEAEARKTIKRITGLEYEQLPESMKRGRVPKSIPASLRKDAFMKTALSRKDYILIATVLKDALTNSADPAGTDAIEDVAERFTRVLLQDNANFNREHFLSVVHGQKGLTSRPGRGKDFTQEMEEIANRPPKRSLPNPADIKLPHESSARAPRLAGIKVSGIDPGFLNAAEQLIEEDDPLIYDVAADMGQIVDNVKHMSWFKKQVAEWLAEDPSYLQERVGTKALI